MATVNYLAPRIPLSRLVICINCEDCTEYGEPACGGCGSEHLLPIATWLDLRREGGPD